MKTAWTHVVVLIPIWWHSVAHSVWSKNPREATWVSQATLEIRTGATALPRLTRRTLLCVYSGDCCKEPLLLVRGRHRLLRPCSPPRVSPNIPAASSEQVRVKGSHQEGKIYPLRRSTPHSVPSESQEQRVTWGCGPNTPMALHKPCYSICTLFHQSSPSLSSPGALSSPANRAAVS